MSLLSEAADMLRARTDREIMRDIRMTRKRRPVEVAADALAAIPGAPEACIGTINAPPQPILLVVRLDRDPGEEVCNRIRSAVERAFGGEPHPPVVVLAPGITIEAVLDPRGTPCSSPATESP